MQTTIVRRLPPATPDQLAILTPHQRGVYHALRNEVLTQTALAERDGTAETTVHRTVRRIAAKLGHTDDGRAPGLASALRKARSLPVLDAGTDAYMDGGHRMLWLVRASESTGFPSPFFDHGERAASRQSTVGTVSSPIRRQPRVRCSARS